MTFRFRVAVVTIALCAALLGARQSAHAQAPVTHAPVRIELIQILDWLKQCGVHISPGALMAAHARYCAAYLGEYEQLDRQHALAMAGLTPEADALPTVKGAQRSIQESRQSAVSARALADALLDELAESVPEINRDAFTAFRTEFHIALEVRRGGGGFGGPYLNSNSPWDLGWWIGTHMRNSRGSDEEQEAVRAARTIAGPERLAAAKALMQAQEESFLRAAQKAEELQIAGKSARELIQAQQEVEQSVAPSQPSELEQVQAAEVLDVESWKRLAAVQLAAWRRAAPLMPVEFRRRAMASFLCSLSNRGMSWEGNISAGGLPVSVDRAHDESGVGVVRTALSVPGLSSEQKQQLRHIGAEWLDARMAELEALAAHTVAHGPPSNLDPILVIDARYRARLAEAAKAPWLKTNSVNPRANSTIARNRPDNAPVPKRDELKLDPQDDALFPLPRSSSAAWSTYLATPRSLGAAERREGLPPTMPDDSAAQFARALGLGAEHTATTDLVWQDFDRVWKERVEPLRQALKDQDAAVKVSIEWYASPEEEQERRLAQHRQDVEKLSAVRHQLWDAAMSCMTELGTKLAASVPDSKKNAALVWVAAQQLAMQLPVSEGARAFPNLASVAFHPLMSPEGRAKIVDAMTNSAPAAVQRADAARWALYRLRGPDRYYETKVLGTAGTGDTRARFDEMVAQGTKEYESLRDAYLHQANSDSAQVRALLNDADATVWRRAIDNQGLWRSVVTLLPILEALGDAPENQAARAAVMEEEERLAQTTDRAFALLTAVPYSSDFRQSDFGTSPLHTRADIYVRLAREQRLQALWRLRHVLPPEIAERNGVTTMVAEVESVAP